MDVWRGVVRRLFDSPTPRHYEDDYELLPPEPCARINLPTSNGHPRAFRVRAFRPRSPRAFLFACVHFFTFRRTVLALSWIPFLFCLVILWSGIPPSFNDIRTFERILPQHNLTTAKDGKFIRFPGHLWGHGLNNILQEAILMSYLAYVSNRSFVFEDYVWSHTPFPYTVYDLALRPARIPLNAFISGPTAGGPMAAPRAISAEFWDLVCPKEKRHVVSSADAPNKAQGSVIVDWWADKLASIEHACVEIDSSSKVVFDRYLFGDERILSLWPGLSASPILADYTWSPLVQSAVFRNFAILQPPSAASLYALSSPTRTISGLVAVHLRRGDYLRHCPRLATWGSLYMGINEFPALPDRFDPAPLRGRPHGELEAYYMAHCLPTVEQIVARLHALRSERAGLRRVYVLTNGWGWWLGGLRSALLEDGWDDLKSSYDLQLDSEQRYVAMSADMAIAEKAEVFVGNGFSSLSSNIVMLRMAKGLDVTSNRFL